MAQRDRVPGRSQTGERFLHLSGWREKADTVGLIAVFPTALKHFVLEEGRWATRWHDIYLPAEVDLALRPPGYPEDAPWPADDVAFVRAMLDDLVSAANADPDRVYATGFSNGAAFTARLAVEATDRITAFAYAGGRFCDPLAADWTSALPRPVFMVLGAVDTKILGHITGGDTTLLQSLPLDPDSLLGPGPVADCLAAAVGTFDLEWEPYDVLELAGQTWIEWSTSRSEPRGSALRLVVVAGLGHRYPNGENNPLGWDAPARFWEFFRDFRLSI